MSLFEQAMDEMRASIVDELEQRIWERLEPRIQQELLARHMSVAELAKYLHVSDWTARRLIRERTIPSFRVGGQIFVRQMDVDEWIRKQVEGARES
ncbi:helix-turn-helix domain-containing protein [Alicyclobacillus macrosporangiidus]|uniref:DNA binding domain-containing protein, excisionase family n=1 Tax=Alicyclobacillus macrosporangiidus TaxID=392015 RepID=A0A1I7JA59_9BACL|nr:helix-turn-helix domain-containing protein [Alicyclobacillus macrosporangiidus]SFU82077.1 DNA binding domain-containing protein, excisionase family [Alicyclobacillus macrosporangiidus]